MEAEFGVQALVVPPPHPLEGRELDRDKSTLEENNDYAEQAFAANLERIQRWHHQSLSLARAATRA